MNLLEARDKLGAVLAPVADDDPMVFVNLTDTIEPPALLLGWDDPWLEPDTSCVTRGRMLVTAVVPRSADGQTRLEELVQYVLGRLKADPGNWPLLRVGGPRVFEMAKTKYLATRISVRVTIT